MTKKQAIEVGNELGASLPMTVGLGIHPLTVIDRMIEALDRAGAFQSEEAAAEIDAVSREVLKRAGLSPKPWTGMMQRAALRLATACRAAGLVKP